MVLWRDNSKSLVLPRPESKLQYSMKDIEVVIDTYNVEKHMKECLASAKLLTPNLFIVDMHSTDQTVRLAETAGARVEFVPFAEYVEPARQVSIEHSQADWVFILDADERITPELADEVKKAIKNPEFSHYKIPRKNIFARQKWLQHGGWWPDPQLRLIRRDSFKKWPEAIHATPQVEGKQGLLTQPILHYFHGDIEKMVEKTIIFEDIESELLFKADKHVSTLTFFRKFLGELNRRLFRNAGYRDGAVGIIESVYQAYSKTITYLYLYEKKKSGTV